MSLTGLPAETTIDFLHLTVRNLQAMSSFYIELLGFREIGRTGFSVSFSASGKAPAQLVLTHQPNAQARSPRSSGLFHVAYLFPDQKELAQAFLRLYRQGYPFQGFADHGVSEAIYLADPEGNGIELYADRPRDQWEYKNGALEMKTAPLDIDNLIATLGPSPTLVSHVHPAMRIGHIHLQVSDLGKAERFYHELLGFNVMQRSYPGALFVSAGGYHHHLGLNIWNSRGNPALPEGTAGLAAFGIALPTQSSVERLWERLNQAGVPITDAKAESFRSTDFDNITTMVHTAGTFIPFS